MKTVVIHPTDKLVLKYSPHYRPDKFSIDFLNLPLILHTVHCITKK